MTKAIDTKEFPRLTVPAADSLARSQKERIVFIKGSTVEDIRGKLIATFPGDTLAFAGDDGLNYKYEPISDFVRESTYNAILDQNAETEDKNDK
jgi:hypothetical protein